MKPIYKDLEFKTDQEFKKWLSETTDQVIQFKDNHQDLLLIHVAYNGEIIDCNAQSIIWNGKFVNLKGVEIGKPIKFWDNTVRRWKKFDFIVEKVYAGYDPTRIYS